METPQLIGGFKQRFDRFVEHYKTVKLNNATLVEKVNDLTKELDKKNSEIEMLKNSNKTNELANAFVVSEGSSQQAKQSINKLVREIDNCIALLNR